MATKMELTIEKMIYGGDGLARLPANGTGRAKTVFVPFVLAGEQVEASSIREKSGIIYAHADRVLAGSRDRVEPVCPYFYRCGGCHYQHTDYEHQLQIKSDILRETLQRTAKLNWASDIQLHPSPAWNYRNRTRMHVRARVTEAESQFAIGYYRIGSHDLLPVESCPISSPLINKAIAAVWKLGRDGKVPAPVHEVEFFANAEDSQLLLKFYSAYEPEPDGQRELKDFAEALRSTMPQIVGTAAFATGSTMFPWDSAAWSFGSTHLNYTTAHGNYRVHAGSFFQTNRFLIDDLVTSVTDGRSGKLALDLYAGTGLFSAVLGKTFDRVIAVESSGSSLADLSENSPANVEAVDSAAEDFLRRLPQEPKPDYIVVDPPRAGLGDKVTRQLGKIEAPAIAYVSCDPATLSRDLKMLNEFGYRVQSIHLFDLFPQTFHIESVVHLSL